MRKCGFVVYIRWHERISINFVMCDDIYCGSMEKYPDILEMHI